jgi:antitoxin (DNA-binding transcriptional repressor) of toxin-antitoxin stability system
MSEPAESLRVSNSELATVREAMRELHRLLAQLDDGELEKVVLTQRNQMRAVLVTLERYSELERSAASAGLRHELRAGPMIVHACPPASSTSIDA